jgi:hypothetical protein
VHTPDFPFHTPPGYDTEHALLAVLTAALQVAENHVRADARDLAPALDPNQLPVRVVLFTAALVADRCAELRSLLQLYAHAYDDLRDLDDNPF